MTNRQRYLFRFIVQGALLCVAGVATLAGQTTSQPPQGSGGAPVRALTGETTSVAKSPEEVAPIVGIGPKGEYTGDKGCRNCHKHDKIWNNFYKDPHFKSSVSGKEPVERVGCESCHGAGKKHVEAGGDIDTVVNAFSVMKPPAIIALCLNCHAKEFSRANIERSEHTQHEVACTACHSIHTPATERNLLSKSQPEACYGCHADVRAQFNLPSKHRVNEGFMSCSDCHNPHGDFTPTFGMGNTNKMLNQSHSNEQPCMKCHVEKRGPFLYPHQVSEVDGCIGCHKPHGSTNAKLLTRPSVTALCLECHTGSGDFGVRMNRGILFPEKNVHSMVDPRYQRCTTCHVTIHGSNIHYRFLR